VPACGCTPHPAVSAIVATVPVRPTSRRGASCRPVESLACHHDSRRCHRDASTQRRSGLWCLFCAFFPLLPINESVLTSPSSIPAASIGVSRLWWRWRCIWHAGLQAALHDQAFAPSISPSLSLPPSLPLFHPIKAPSLHHHRCLRPRQAPQSPLLAQTPLLLLLPPRSAPLPPLQSLPQLPLLLPQPLLRPLPHPQPPFLSCQKEQWQQLPWLPGSRGRRREGREGEGVEEGRRPQPAGHPPDSA